MRGVAVGPGHANGGIDGRMWRRLEEQKLGDGQRHDIARRTGFSRQRLGDVLGLDRFNLTQMPERGTQEIVQERPVSCFQPPDCIIVLEEIIERAALIQHGAEYPGRDQARIDP